MGYNIQSGGKKGSFACDLTKERIKEILTGRVVTWADQVSMGVVKLWEYPKYREKQTKQRYEKRGKYRDGIVGEKSRKSVDMVSFIYDYSNYLNLSVMSEKYNISINTIYKTIKRENILKRGCKCNQIKE